MKTQFDAQDIKRMSGSLLKPASAPVLELRVGTPWLEVQGDKTYQKCRIGLGDVEKEVFFAVPNEFGEFLTYERGDAYLLGLLSFAMRERCNFRFDVPLTGELVHQITTELLPVLTRYSPELHFPEIKAEYSDEPLPCAGKVGTGCSCGVDSMYAIKRLTETPFSAAKVDCLAVHNVGAYTWGGRFVRMRYEYEVDHARAFALRYGYQLLVTDSNIAEQFPQMHEMVHTYTASFATYMLRKFWRRYYYASAGVDLLETFRLSNIHHHHAVAHALVLMPAVSIQSLRISTESESVTRWEKMKELIDYEPAQLFLNVCAHSVGSNCGKCYKCMRTLWQLDALGALERFVKVFPIEQYRCNYEFYLRQLYLAHLHHQSMVGESYDVLRRKIGIGAKVWAVVQYLKTSFSKF